MHYSYCTRGKSKSETTAMMEKPQSVDIRYTAKLFPPAPTNARQRSSLPSPFLTYSQDNVPLDSLLQENSSNPNAEPVLEIVTSFHAIEPKGDGLTERPMEVLRSVIDTSHKSTLMIIHSASLSQIIRDLVKHYPR